MKANYAEDIWVPSVGNEKWARGGGLLSDIREESFSPACFTPVWLYTKEGEDGRSVVIQCCRLTQACQRKGSGFLFFFHLKGIVWIF